MSLKVVRGSPRTLPSRISREIMKRLGNAPLAELLVLQAKRRMKAGRDSTMIYPDLWDHPRAMRRKGDQPLLDTGTTIAMHLNSQQTVNQRTITLKLRSGGPNPKVALYHQHGFKTKGPNFIPFTAKAKRNQSQFKGLMKKRSAVTKKIRTINKQKKPKAARRVALMNDLRSADAALEAAGFIEGETYMMAWKGVTVPQRKIFNMPPEDVADIKRAVKDALT